MPETKAHLKQHREQHQVPLEARDVPGCVAVTVPGCRVGAKAASERHAVGEGKRQRSGMPLWVHVPKVGFTSKVGKLTCRKARSCRSR